MNKLYFTHPENVKKLSNELDEWIGTPYRHYCCVKKRGVDCALFLGKVFFNLAILCKLDYTYYSRDWHKHNNTNIFLNNFEQNIKNNLANDLKISRVECDIMPLEAGDWLMYSTNSKLINHSALYLGDGKIIHAIQRRGVIVDKLKTWKPFLKRTYRLYYV